MTWATIGRMLIIHCFEEKKASLLKTVCLCQNVQFCFVFHEARNANLNLYKRLLKNIQIISKKLRLAVIDSPWLLESPFSRELGTSEWSCKGEGFGCPAEPSVCWRPAWARSCKGPLLIYQGRGSRPLFFSFLTIQLGSAAILGAGAVVPFSLLAWSEVDRRKWKVTPGDAWNHIHISIYFPGGTGAAFCGFSTGTPSKDTDFFSNEPWRAVLVCDFETHGVQATDRTRAAPNANGSSSIWLC